MVNHEDKHSAGDALPSAEELPVIEGMPDPFVMKDGRRARTRDAWAKRREEIKELLLFYEYGFLPPGEETEGTVTFSGRIHGGTAKERRITVHVGPSRRLGIRVRMAIPEGSGPFPVILKNDVKLGEVPLEREMLRRGYIVSEYVRHDVDRDDPNRGDGVHPLYPGYDWGTLAAWAWGAMRVVDYLITVDAVDEDKIAFTGHSRGGKTALLAAALDERISLAAPNGSGTGGCASYRVQGPGAERLDDILKNFPYWFSPRLGQFVGRENRLPFDQHFLRALVAPRAIISTDALGDLWANPIGTQAAFLASQPVFDWLGAPDMNAIHFREGGHEQSAEDWRILLDFADRVLLGKEPGEALRFKTLPFPVVGDQRSRALKG